MVPRARHYRVSATGERPAGHAMVRMSVAAALQCQRNEDGSQESLPGIAILPDRGRGRSFHRGEGRRFRRPRPRGPGQACGRGGAPEPFPSARRINNLGSTWQTRQHGIARSPARPLAGRWPAAKRHRAGTYLMKAIGAATARQRSDQPCVLSDQPCIEGTDN